MAFGERKKMGDKYRQAITATVLTYIDTSKQMKSDPLHMDKLPITGAVVLGEELGAKLGKSITPADSVYWVDVNVKTGAMAGYTKLDSDLSRWRKKLNKQLKKWGKKSEVKKLSTKRAVTAGVIAGIVVAIVVITILTVGVGTGPSAGGGVAIVGGTVGGSALPALNAVGSVAKAGGTMAEAASAAKASLTPTQAAALEEEAISEASVQPLVDTEAPDEDDDMTSWLLPAAGIAAAALAVIGIVVASAPKKS